MQNRTQKISSMVNVNKSVGNSAHFQQNDTSSPDISKTVYTKLHQILKTLVERLEVLPEKSCFSLVPKFLMLAQ